MIKGILAAAIVLLLASFLGCSEISDLTTDLTDESSSTGFEILKEIELDSEWKMNQMSIEIAAGDEFSILLKLADGDKTDGYFYLEEGDDVDFRIKGSSLIYQSEAQDSKATGVITSDRFSFVANQAQGTTYTLTFRNPAADGEEQTKVAVFMEIIYPSTGSMFFPVEAW